MLDVVHPPPPHGADRFSLREKQRLPFGVYGASIARALAMTGDCSLDTWKVGKDAYGAAWRDVNSAAAKENPAPLLFTKATFGEPAFKQKASGDISVSKGFFQTLAWRDWNGFWTATFNTTKHDSLTQPAARTLLWRPLTADGQYGAYRDGKFSDPAVAARLRAPSADCFDKIAALAHQWAVSTRARAIEQNGWSTALLHPISRKRLLRQALLQTAGHQF